MKLLILSDAHIHKHRLGSIYVDGVNSRLTDGLRILDWCLNQADVEGCDFILFSGDLFHISPPPSDVMNHVLERLQPYADRMVMIAGNHDLGGLQYSDEYCVPFRVLREWGASILDGVHTVDLGSVSVGGQHYRRGGVDWSIVPEADILLLHGTVKGSTLDNGYVFDDGLASHTWQDKCRLAIVGHVHKPYYSKQQKFLIPGSIMAVDLGDTSERGCWILDTDTFEPKMLPVSYTLPYEAPEPSDNPTQQELAELPDEGNVLEEYAKKFGADMNVGRDIMSPLICWDSGDVPRAVTLLEVEGKNFFSFEEFKYTVEDGVHFIVGEVDGEPERSNGSGKCLSASTLLTDCRTGETHAIADWYNIRKTALRSLSVFGLGPDLKLHPTPVKDIVDCGEKQLVTVLFDDGSSVSCSKEHPIMTSDGMRKAASLQQGEYVASPRNLNISIDEKKELFTDDDVLLIAAFLAEGGLTGKRYTFTNADSEMIACVSDCLSSYGLTLRRTASNRYNHHLVSSGRDVSALRSRLVDKLLDYGLLTKSWFGCNAPKIMSGDRGVSYGSLLGFYDMFGDEEFLDLANQLWPHRRLRSLFKSLGIDGSLSKHKNFPQLLYCMSGRQTKRFISVYVACDGWVSDASNRVATVSVTSASKSLIDGIKHLLLRFGIRSKLRKRLMRRRFVAYTLCIYSRDSLLALCKVLWDMPCEKKRNRVRQMYSLLLGKSSNNNKDVVPSSVLVPVLRNVAEEANTLLSTIGDHRGISYFEKHGVRRQSVLRLAEQLHSQQLMNLAQSDIVWKQVVSVSKSGRGRTYDIEIGNSTHLYALDSVITHNSSLFDSIVWSLYGRTTKAVKANEVVREGAAEAEVRTRWYASSLDSGWVLFDVIRKRTAKGNTTLELFYRHTEEDLRRMHQAEPPSYTGNPTAVQEQVDRHISINFDTFVECVYFSQENFSLFSRMSNSDRKGLLARVLGLQFYDRACAEAKKRLVSLKEDVVKVESECDAESSALRGLEDKAASAQIHTEELTAELGVLEARKKTLRLPEVSVQDEIDSVDRDLTELSEAIDEQMQAMLELNKLVGSFDVRISAATERRRAHESTIEALQRRESSIESLQDGVICETCGAEVCQKNKNVLLSQCSANRQQVGEELAVVEGELGDLAVKKIAEKKNIDEANAIKKEQEHRKAELQRRRSELKQRLAEVESIKQDRAGLDTKIAEKRGALQETLKQKEKAEEELATVRLRAASLAENLARIRGEVEEVDKWVKIFGPNGVTTVLLENAGAVLTKNVNDFLSNVQSGFRVSFVLERKKVQTALTMDVLNGDTVRSYAALSGGEKQLIDIAVLVALVSMLNARWRLKNGLMGILILDEVISYLDGFNIEAVVEQLKEMPVRSIYLISHISELKSLFDNVMVVRKSEGVSRLT